MVKMKDNWNANLYDANHSFVSNFGSHIVELLAPKQGEKILDLGCGTGDLAKKIAECGADVTGSDKSENMIVQAMNKYPDIKFIVQDATKMEYHEEFDAVFSNAALHWIKPPNKALQGIYNSLKKGGRFVAELGGKGNIQILSDEIIKQINAAGFQFNKEHFPWFFPSIGEYSTLMEETGFRVTFAQHFDRPTTLSGEKGLRNWIEMFGSSMFTGIPVENRDSIITEVEQRLNAVLNKNGEWVADYKRIRVIGIKE